MTNTASKDILARLLATENVTVQHANVPTASFNVRDRILTLPVWEDMEDFTYDHLVGHEVGHALFTPEEGWHDAVVDGGPVFRSFLNVVEDARIEKMIQRRYPGLRRSFMRSYKKMLKDGFFGVDMKHINSMNLIDRINTYFKCGASVGVAFSDNERPWLTRIENAETWEDVEIISRELLAFCKEEFEKKREEEEEGYSDGESDDFENQFSDDSYNDFDLESGGPEDYAEGNWEDSDSEIDSEGEQLQNGSTGGKGKSEQDFENSEISHTEEQLHKNIEKELSTSVFQNIYNFKTSSIDGNRFVKDYKDTIEKIQSASHERTMYCPVAKLRVPQETYMDGFYKEFHSQNKRIVDYAVKEFYMKKKAEEYARTASSKTGTVDTLKMNNYLFDDDIFRRINVVPDGKSHGVLIFLDWSGSMIGNMFAAIQQMCLLSMFCRKADIPFRVFIFTDEESGRTSRPEDELFSIFTLREIFSSSMKKSDFRYMVGAMLAHGKSFDNNLARIYIHEDMCLCGTPLDSAIMYASDVHRDFQKIHSLDKTSTFFITDGESHPVSVLPSDRSYGSNYLMKKYCSLIRITDTQTKKQYRITNNSSTNTLIQMYKDRTSSNTIGYFIVKNSRKQQYEYVVSRQNQGIVSREEDCKFFSKNKFAPAPHPAYDQFFVISKQQMSVNTTEMEVDDGASKAKIRSAFKKSQGNKKSIRVMMNQLIESIA